MAGMNGQQVCDEVAFRIANRLPANGSGAGSIINFTNDVYGLITSAAAWTWTQNTLQSLTPGGSGQLTATQLGSLDMGQKVSVWDHASGTPLVKMDQGEFIDTSAGYIGIGVSSYNGFIVTVDPLNAGGGAIFLTPYQTNFPGVLVDVSFHYIPPLLVYGSSPTVGWGLESAMDMLLKDWATANTMKYLGMSGWDTIWADCMGRLGEFRRMYTTVRENTGPEDEAAKAVQDKATIGRT